MKTLLYFATLSLVVRLTLCSNENQKEHDEDEILNRMH